MNNKNDFDNYIEDFFNVEVNGYNKESLDEILSYFIDAPLNQGRKKGGIELIFLGFKKIGETQVGFEYSLKFQTMCIRCKKEFTFQQNVIYNPEEYIKKPSLFNDSCPNCGLVFHVNAYLRDWWFEGD